MYVRRFPAKRAHGVTRQGGVFYGWWLVAACFLCISTGPQPFVFGSVGFFMKPFGDEFGWSRSTISASLSVFTVTSAICFPLIGRLIDRYGARLVLLVSMFFLGLLLLAIPTFVSEIWHLALIFFLIGVLAAGSNTLSYMPILSAWFDRHRGLAIGISISGIGLGFFYVPILVQYLIDNHGWRAGYVGLGLVVLMVGLPLAAAVIRNSPASMGLTPDGAVMRKPVESYLSTGLTVKESIRTPRFWLMFVVFILMSFVLNGLIAHLVPMLTDREMSPGRAAAAASSVGITVIASRVLVGYLMDRFFAPRVAMVFFGLSAVGIASLAFGAVDALAFLAAVSVGLSLGAELDLMAYLASRYFGLRAFGTIYGLLLAGIVAGAGIAPLAFALWFDLNGSYIGILALCATANVLAVLAVAFLGPYPRWDEDGLEPA